MKSSRSSTNKEISPLFPQASCWVIVDEGCSDLENQCLGLSEAMGLVPTLKRIRPLFPHTYIPKFFWGNSLDKIECLTGSLISGRPKLVIAAGRASTSVASALKARWGCFIISLGKPARSKAKFDVVVPLPHEKVMGKSSIPVLGYLHRITETSLIEAKVRYVRESRSLARPRIMIHLDQDLSASSAALHATKEIFQPLSKLNEEQGASFFIHINEGGREVEGLLKPLVVNLPHQFIHKEVNHAYLGYLAHMDGFVTDPNAVRFISEAVTCGKPIFTYPSTRSSEKLRRFHQALQKEGRCFPLDEETLLHIIQKRNYSRKPLFEPQRIAKLIWDVYKARVDNEDTRGGE